MGEFFGRVVRLVVAPKTNGTAHPGFDLSNIDCSFQVKKSLRAKPNTCELKVYNLAPNTRRALEGASRLLLRLDAGYESNTAQLFYGEIRSAHTHREGPDLVTEISTGDSEKEMSSSQMSLSLGPKVPVHVVLETVVRELGVGPGNSQQVATKLAGAVYFGPGTTFTGSAARTLTDLCRSAGLEWSVQDGILQILEQGRAVEGTAMRLSPSTGLIGSPTIDNKGVLSVSALIHSSLAPGRKIIVDSESIQGAYRIETVDYTGDTVGNDWTAKMACRTL